MKRNSQTCGNPYNCVIVHISFNTGDMSIITTLGSESKLCLALSIDIFMKPYLTLHASKRISCIIAVTMSFNVTVLKTLKGIIILYISKVTSDTSHAVEECDHLAQETVHWCNRLFRWYEIIKQAYPIE